MRAWVTRHAAACAACGARWVTGEPCPACAARVASLHPAPPTPPPSVEGGPGGLSLAPGTRVGPLEVQDELGRGAAGVVYRARHVELGRACALKVLPGASREERRRRRFENEVQALARLGHPGIVRVHAVHEVAGHPALELELIEGRTLEERVRAQGPLPWRQAVALVAQLAHALEHAHRLQVLHRDLKPGNVLIRDADGSGVVADFGLTRLSDQASSLTVAGALLGTPLYMAPEAFQGEFTPRTDVYGLGALLYQAVSGKAPFRPDNAAALQYQILTGRVAPLALEGVPPELERVRARAMAVDPAARFGSAEEMAADLERLLRGERPIAAPIRRRRGLRLAGAVLGAGLVAGGLVAALRGGPSLPPAPARATPGGVPGALADLGDPTAPARARESAFLRLRAACAPGNPEQPALREGLDQALARARDPAGLHLIRALLERALGRPLRAEDLAGAIRADAALLGSADVEGLAWHGLERGCTPPWSEAATLAAVRAACTARRDAPALRALLGVCLCAGGDPGDRPEAASALFDPPPPPAAARAVLLARALRQADALAEELETGGEPPDAGQPLAGSIEALLRDPPLARAPALVLARVARAVPLAITSGRLADFSRPLLGEATARALHAGRPALPPAASALGALVGDVLDDSQGWYRRPRSRELGEWGEALAEEQPLLGLVALQLGLQYALEHEPSADPSALRGLLEREERLEARLNAAHPARGGSGEELLWARTIHRTRADRAAIEQRLAGQEPASRAEHLERALEHARVCFDLTTRYRLTWRQTADLELLLRLAFETGRLDEVERVAARAREAPAALAELLRRRGHPDQALERTRSLLADPSLPDLVRSDLLAIAALSELDLGQPDAARVTLGRLQDALRRDPSLLLDAWSPAAIEARLRE